MREIDTIRALVRRCVDAGDIAGLQRVETVLHKLWVEVSAVRKFLAENMDNNRRLDAIEGGKQ